MLAAQAPEATRWSVRDALGRLRGDHSAPEGARWPSRSLLGLLLEEIEPEVGERASQDRQASSLPPEDRRAIGASRQRISALETKALVGDGRGVKLVPGATANEFGSGRLPGSPRLSLIHISEPTRPY